MRTHDHRYGPVTDARIDTPLDIGDAGGTIDGGQLEPGMPGHEAPERIAVSGRLQVAGHAADHQTIDQQHHQRCHHQQDHRRSGVLHAQQPAQQRGNHDRNQHRGVDVAGSQNRNNKEAKNAQQYAVGRQVADAHQGFRVGDDHAGVLQAHHTDEQANTAGDTDTQANRDIGDHPVANLKYRQQQETHRAPEDSAHRDLPRQTHRADHDKGEKGVQAHRWRQRHRQVSQQAHENTTKGGDQTGGDKHRFGVHPGGTQNLRVDENDIHHRQEGGEPGNGLGTSGGAVLFQFEHAIQQPLLSSGTRLRFIHDK